MIEIQVINELREGSYMITYSYPSACGCTMHKKTVHMISKEKPTIKQALKYIHDLKD